MLEKRHINQGKEYNDHKVFSILEEVIEFYEYMSGVAMGFIIPGYLYKGNIDRHIFSSMQGTTDSIKTILEKARIGDGFTLLRKFHDAIILNVFTLIKLEDGLENEFPKYVVDEINDWIIGEKKAPTYRKMSETLNSCSKLQKINELINHEAIKDIRKRGNDNTHYNYLSNLIVNDNEIYIKYRLQALDRFQTDFETLFTLHLVYLFTVKGEYMSSSDYIDYKDMDMAPPDGSEYWVANIIQETLNKFVREKSPKIYQELKNNSFMKLE